MIGNLTTTKKQPNFTGYYQGIFEGAKNRVHTSKKVISCYHGDELFLSIISKLSEKNVNGITVQTKGTGKKANLVFDITKEAYEKAFTGLTGQIKKLLLQNNIGKASDKEFTKIIKNPNLKTLKFELNKEDLDIVRKTKKFDSKDSNAQIANLNKKINQFEKFVRKALPDQNQWIEQFFQ